MVHERIMEELLGELSLSRSSSIEDLYGFELIDGVPITPPLVPSASPKPSPPPAPLSSPSPALQPSPAPPRAAPNWTDGEIELVLKYFNRYGPKFRRISRFMAGRSEDAVRQLLKRRGLLVPRSSPIRRRSSKAPRWTRSEDRRLMEALEAVPRHKRGNVPWRKVKAVAGLDRLPHALRNRMRRLEEMGF